MLHTASPDLHGVHVFVSSVCDCGQVRSAHVAHAWSHHSSRHERQLRRWWPDRLKSRGWHIRQRDVPAIDESALEDGTEVLVEVFSIEPKEAILSFLRILLISRQRIRDGDVLKATVIDTRTAAEELKIQTAFPMNCSIYSIWIIRIQPDALQLTCRRIWPADKKRVPLQVVDVDEQPVGGDILRVESAGDASCEVSEGVLDLAAAVQCLPASHVLL
mmetsp:Transcript_8213/g.19633  ORF Transcript_8213/g.19633 Transcript_8213/m.19633 type:complete len:217 (-) Transcript_8213:1210-1860(-)